MRKNTKRTNNSKKKMQKTQKLWNMVGCSKKRIKRGASHNRRRCAYKKTQIRRQKGGCGVCLQSGGGAAGGALVGSPWTGSVSDWPGVAGKDGQTNYFSLNTYPVDPQTQNIISERSDININYMKGGKRMKSRGGGIIPQDLVNLGRSMVYGIGSAYNSLNGYSPPVNPLPYKDQLVNAMKR